MHPAAVAWFERRTSHWSTWPVGRLTQAKGAARVSVVLPALDEQATIGAIVAGVRGLAVGTGLVDEVVVIDSGSSDATVEVASRAGAQVYRAEEILPGHGNYPGKGEALWKSLAVTTGDVIIFVDSDLTDFQPHFITGLLGPLLTQPEVALVKAYYDRPLLDTSPAGGGRVTELMARPLFNAYFPELAGVVQPLAGEYAARRSLLEALPFDAGYGVETGLLIDAWRGAGLDAIAQVDLGQRTHGHQDTSALGRMAATVLHSVIRRADPGRPLWTVFTQFSREDQALAPHDTEVTWPQRPPMVTIPEYLKS